MKKTFIILLTVCMFFAVLPVCVSAAQVSSEWKVDVTNNGEAEIVGYIGKSKDVEIPSKLNGHAVTSIGENAFAGSANIKSVNIPSTVTSLEKNAFKGCTGLKSIKLPTGMIKIGDYAFCGCTGLTSLNLPGSLKNIGECAFMNCGKLKAVTVPISVESIGKFAFGYIDKGNKRSISKDFALYGKSAIAAKYANDNGIIFVGQCPHERMICIDCMSDQTQDELLTAWGYKGSGTGSVISGGSMTIICAVVALAVGLCCGIMLGKKKNSLALAEGTETANEDE